ncbi:hypothetical protein B7494_g1502 [Chlorociboria aeruginascens]|nr:hypothetical protein B7494_g1502 [Chlorociboria aeruginascens]
MSTFFQQYLYSQAPSKQPKEQGAIKLGILSTAMIDPAAVIHPVETHTGAKITAVGSRDLSTAQKFSKKYSIEKAYGSYEELLADKEIDAVYISVPNGLHAEWAIKSMVAGKHVLIEKPVSANAEETQLIFECAKKHDKVAMEAFHWQFHPAAHVVHALVSSGKYGEVLSTYARMTTPTGSIPSSDIRWQFDLAGGSLMDMTYVVSATRYFLDAGASNEVIAAKARPMKKDKRVDESIEATLNFMSHGKTVTADIFTDMNLGNIGHITPRLADMPSIKIELEKATIYYYNFMMPHLYHYIEVTEKTTGAKHSQKHYNFGPKWGTRSEPYQLEAFIDKLQGNEQVHWITPESSIMQMETIDAIYVKAGLPKRQGSLSIQDLSALF